MPRKTAGTKQNWSNKQKQQSQIAAIGELSAVNEKQEAIRKQLALRRPQARRKMKQEARKQETSSNMQKATNTKQKQKAASQKRKAESKKKSKKHKAKNNEQKRRKQKTTVNKLASCLNFFRLFNACLMCWSADVLTWAAQGALVRASFCGVLDWLALCWVSELVSLGFRVEFSAWRSGFRARGKTKRTSVHARSDNKYFGRHDFDCFREIQSQKAFQTRVHLAPVEIPCPENLLNSFKRHAPLARTVSLVLIVGLVLILPIFVYKAVTKRHSNEGQMLSTCSTISRSLDLRLHQGVTLEPPGTESRMTRRMPSLGISSFRNAFAKLSQNWA